MSMTKRRRSTGVALLVSAAFAGAISAAPAKIPGAPAEPAAEVECPDRMLPGAKPRNAAEEFACKELHLQRRAGKFRIDGGAGDFYGRGTICNINAPFTVKGGGNTVKFVPTSEKGGTYTYAGNMQGFGVFGNGTYTVAYAGGEPVAITATGPGSVKTPMGVHSNVGTEKYKLRPAPSAACP
jgi:hypothetical protein